MGIFSLARRTPRILSKVSGRRAWAIELHQDHFIGRESAPVTQAEPGFDGDHGTDVTFSTLPTDKDWIPGVIAAALRHYPIPARVNGRKAEQIDFLAEAVRTLTWRGLRIGVFAADRDPYVAPTINFHGLEVRCDELPQVHALPSADAKATRFWWTGVDVVDCPDLELTLPTRTAIVQTPFIGELVTEAQRAIYRTITSARALAAARVRDPRGRGRRRRPASARSPATDPLDARERPRGQDRGDAPKPRPRPRHPRRRRRPRHRPGADPRLGRPRDRHPRPVLADRAGADRLRLVRQAAQSRRSERTPDRRRRAREESQRPAGRTG